MPVLRLHQGLRQLQKLLPVDEAALVCDLFNAGDMQPLALLEGGHEVGGIQKGIVASGVEPGKAAAQKLDMQPSPFQIRVVDRRDLQLAARFKTREKLCP